MEIEKIPVKSLVFDPDNARKHSKKNLDAIKASLTAFGQQKPIVVDKKNRVIAGNGTLTAAIELGWSDIGAVRSVLKGNDAKAFALADNRTAELAEWDIDILNDQLFELKEQEFNLDSLGFDIKDIDVAGYNRRHGMPEDDSTEFDDESKEPKFLLSIEFQNDEDQQNLFIELRDRGFKVKAK